MKLLLASFLFLCFVSSGFAQSLGSNIMEKKYGFRDAHFEMDTAAFTDLARFGGAGKGADKDSRWYTRSNDSKTVGNAELEAIYYVFYKGKLSKIIIEVKGANSAALLDALTAQYGQPFKAAQFSDDYFWQSKRERISFDIDRIGYSATVFFKSRVMQKIEETDQKAAAQKAVSDL